MCNIYIWLYTILVCMCNIYIHIFIWNRCTYLFIYTYIDTHGWMNVGRCGKFFTNFGPKNWNIGQPSMPQQFINMVNIKSTNPWYNQQHRETSWIVVNWATTPGTYDHPNWTKWSKTPVKTLHSKELKTKINQKSGHFGTWWFSSHPTIEKSRSEPCVRWSLGLVARVLMRTIVEGSTSVMQAIHADKANGLLKALLDQGGPGGCGGPLLKTVAHGYRCLCKRFTGKNMEEERDLMGPDKWNIRGYKIEHFPFFDVFPYVQAMIRCSIHLA